MNFASGLAYGLCIGWFCGAWVAYFTRRWWDRDRLRYLATQEELDDAWQQIISACTPEQIEAIAEADRPNANAH